MGDLATLSLPGELIERPDMTDLTGEQIAPLERLFDPLMPDTWRDFALSHYLTLQALFGGRFPDTELAALSVELSKGIAADLGGTQPYIQAGRELLASKRARRVIELLQAGKSYPDVAAACGKITERHVRQIEKVWLDEQRRLRQGRLDL